MASYDEIKDYVFDKYGFIPKSCWIADIKEECGLPVRVSPQRKATEKCSRSYPCPQKKREPIKEALRHFKMIDEEQM